jgi:hypothetical protein
VSTDKDPDSVPWPAALPGARTPAAMSSRTRFDSTTFAALHGELELALTSLFRKVSMIEPVPAGRPLPVQAFLSCAGDVVARIGTSRLQAVQVLLPVQNLDPSAPVSAAMTLLSGRRLVSPTLTCERGRAWR